VNMESLPKRIGKEIKRFHDDPVPGIRIANIKGDLRYFYVQILGPSSSPYEGGYFDLELWLPEDYPMTAPKVHFLRPVPLYHPNIDKLGRICLDVLKGHWSPALQIRTILLSIQSLLASPNLDDPLEPNIAKAWKDGPSAAAAKAKQMTLAEATEEKSLLRRMKYYDMDPLNPPDEEESDATSGSKIGN